jgi:hypothetical protein
MSPTVWFRSFGLCLLLLLACGVASAQSTSNSWIRGTWEGTGYQTDSESTWQMVLKVFKAGGKRFAIEYPSLSCGGRWQLISLNAWRARFRERLDHGQDKCADNGQVMIQRLNRNQILFVYSNQGEKELTASAILNRKR